ncbi:amino acid permease [Acinetobacter sp. YIM 103518]|uniref:Amino acid permease n=1 Tax=Acinetobacter faecalis TaxID=2665161 RepID=A0A6L6GJV9_9GAMM|nr:amino acid permease [Acinetobacter faecalis]MTD12034.1 amino acid permease [Acinetobacter faecalis]
MKDNKLSNGDAIINESNGKLSHSLSSRQVSMITIGGIIGAGLFIASAPAINQIGPAVLFSYIIVGVLVFLIMRMLAEMAVRNPDSGSFSVYAERALGHWAGFTTGWLYWWFWMLVVAFEAVMGAAIIHAYLPSLSEAAIAFTLLILLFSTNLFNVKNFGEFEFWFALIKVVAILIFIAIGAMAIFGYWPLNPNISGIANIYQHDGLLPAGPGSILSGILLIMFSFFGVEMLSIAAAEAKHPVKEIRRSTNLVIYRIGIFYVLSIFLVLCIVPWNDKGLQEMGTFQYVLHVLNVPGSKLIMDMVVLVSVCSVLNTGLYISSRMLFSLSSRGDAPKTFSDLTAGQVPRKAVIVTALLAFICLIINYFASEGLFFFFLSTLGAISLLVYLIIALSQLKTRKQLEQKGEVIDFKMWCFPYLTYAVILLIVITLGYMFINKAFQYETMVTLGLTIFTIILSFIFNHQKKKKNRIKLESESVKNYASKNRINS